MGKPNAEVSGFTAPYRGAHRLLQDFRLHADRYNNVLHLLIQLDVSVSSSLIGLHENALDEFSAQFEMFNLSRRHK